MRPDSVDAGRVQDSDNCGWEVVRDMALAWASPFLGNGAGENVDSCGASASAGVSLGRDVDRKGGNGDESISMLQSGGRYDEKDVKESVEMDSRLLLDMLGVELLAVDAEVRSFSPMKRFFRTFSVNCATSVQLLDRIPKDSSRVLLT